MHQPCLLKMCLDINEAVKHECALVSCNCHVFLLWKPKRLFSKLTGVYRRMPKLHIDSLFASDLTVKVTRTNLNFFLVPQSTFKFTAMSTSRLNLRSSQFQYDSYSDFVRAEHTDNFRCSDTNRENLYWLYDAFQPYTVFPLEQFGVSIVEVVNGHIHLKWSSSFEMQDEVLKPLPNYPSTSTNAAAELLRRIDNGGAPIEFRVIIVHCFPSVLHQRPRCCDYLPQDPA